MEKKEELKENNDNKYENFKNRKSRRNHNMNKNENIENELKNSEMLRDSFGKKVLNDLRTFR